MSTPEHDRAQDKRECDPFILLKKRDLLFISILHLFIGAGIAATVFLWGR